MLNLNKNIAMLSCAFVVASPVAGSSWAIADDLPAAAPDVVAKIKGLYPNTSFSSIRQSPIPGLSEVVMGDNVAYVDPSGRYFLFGHIYDMQEGKDLTARKAPAPSAPAKIDFAALPLADAIVNVQGNGQRKLAVFSDPDCPYCQRLSKALAKVENVTVYTFLMPLDELHPEARKRSAAVWCAKDRSAAWLDLMERGIAPKTTGKQKQDRSAATAGCDTPLDRNLELASRLGVRGTPALFAEDGRMMAGAGSTEQLERFLVQPVKTTAKENRP